MTAVEIVVPDGCTAGMLFSVDWGGVSYDVAVPDGVGPGETILIELPSLEEGPGDTHQHLAALSLAEEPALDDGSGGCFLTQHTPSLADTSLAPTGQTAELLSAVVSGGKYAVQQVLEVCRSDGSWSQARVIDWEDRGDTYTVELLGSGALKYMVESSYLRAGREGAMMRGALVEVVRRGVLYPGGRVDEYDDETETYTVRRHDSGGSGLLFFVTDEEMRAVSYW